MPLSEHEQRVLAEMEKNLSTGTPRETTTSAPTSTRSVSYRNVVIGVLLVVVGAGILLAGIAIPLAVLGVIGFAVMLGGVWLALVQKSERMPDTIDEAFSPSKGASASKDAARKKQAARTSFMDRLSERWENRRGRDF